MNTITILATIAILAGVGILATNTVPAVIQTAAQQMMENVSNNMTSGNMTAGGSNMTNATMAAANMTEATGEISRTRCGGLCDTYSLE